MAMRQRGYVSFGFLAFDRPMSVSVSIQRNAGGMWLGEELSEVVTSFGAIVQLTDQLSVSGYVSKVDSSASFFDDAQ